VAAALAELGNTRRSAVYQKQKHESKQMFASAENWPYHSPDHQNQDDVTYSTTLQIRVRLVMPMDGGIQWSQISGRVIAAAKSLTLKMARRMF
jgi:hypothetical protein